MASFTQTQLEALEAAIAKGVRLVQYNGQKVEYASIDEMLEVRRLMKGELDAEAGTTPARRQRIVAYTGKGF